MGVRKGQPQIVIKAPQCLNLSTRHNIYEMIQTRVPWLSEKIARISFIIVVYNYRINKSELHDLTPWSRVLAKVIVSRLINKLQTTSDDKLLCLLLHRSDQLVVHEWRGKLEEGRHCTRTTECFLSVSKTYNEWSYECSPNRHIQLAGRTAVSLAATTACRLHVRTVLTESASKECSDFI